MPTRVTAIASQTSAAVSIVSMNPPRSSTWMRSAGVPAQRIPVEDLGGFMLTMLTAALLCAAIAVTLVGITQGWVFAPYYLETLALFGAVILGATLVAGAVLSAASWPTAEVLAARRPAAARLRGVATVLEAGVFTLVLATVAPAASAYALATQSAAQQATWYF